MTDLHGKTVEAGLKPCLQRLGGVLTILHCTTSTLIARESDASLKVIPFNIYF